MNKILLICSLKQRFHSYGLRLAAVDGHGDLLLDVGLEEVLEGVVVQVQPGLPDGNDEVEESLQARAGAGGVLLLEIGRVNSSAIYSRLQTLLDKNV